jgi:hypothetical protein
MNTSTWKKNLTIGVILLFIGVAVAPSINSTAVKTSNDNNPVEVTSQACGIKGFGNTTVKLTKEQYQNLEQYLVDFRARLNQTSTREKAVPLFKDAVVELNKYGLLPKGMSIEQAQKLVIGRSQNKNLINSIRKIQCGSSYLDNENYICLIVGQTSNTKFQTFSTSCLEKIDEILNYFFGLGIPYPLIAILFIINVLNPFSFIQRIGMGCHVPDVSGYYNAHGWIYTNGVLGIKKWNGTISGTLNQDDIQGILNYYSSAVGGFTGLKIINIFNNGYFYLGTALKIKISVS